MLVARLIVRTISFPILVFCAGLFLLIVVDHYHVFWQPEIPIYPGAQQVQRTTGTEGISQGEITISFETNDTPAEVRGYYLRELEKRGWHWETGCEFFWHAGLSPAYLAFVDASTSAPRLTRATVRYGEGHLSCDYGEVNEPRRAGIIPGTPRDSLVRL